MRRIGLDSPSPLASGPMVPRAASETARLPSVPAAMPTASISVTPLARRVPRLRQNRAVSIRRTNSPSSGAPSSQRSRRRRPAADRLKRRSASRAASRAISNSQPHSTAKSEKAITMRVVSGSSAPASSKIGRNSGITNTSSTTSEIPVMISTRSGYSSAERMFAFSASLRSSMSASRSSTSTCEPPASPARTMPT